MRKYIREFFHELFSLNIDLIFALSNKNGICSSIYVIQNQYDRAVSAQNKFYAKMTAQFLVVSLLDGIIVEYDSEPEEYVFLQPKTATVTVRNDSGSRKALVIHCIDSKLPK